jgi:DNA topoisomerase-2
MSKNIEDKYKVLDQISHILLRPGTYVGSNKPGSFNKFIICDDKVTQKELTIIPSFIKIFDEVVTNSVDEHKRNKNLNKIDIIIDVEKNIISVRDNGGIPIEIHKDHNQYVPEVIFGNLMSGSNYDDTDERTVSGLNGLGAKLTNVFSEEFTVSSCDGKKHFTQSFRNNMRDKNQPTIKKSKDNHTMIIYKPDLSQFGMEKIDEDHFKIIEKRIYDLAGCNPGIKFTFNGNTINFKSFEDYVKLYTQDYFFESSKNKNWSIAIALSENGFQQVSFANSTETYDGGTHIDYIMNQIIVALREFFMKKHKVDIKPSELKQHMFLFLDSTIINPSFSSQTKEKLITEIKDFGSTFEVSDKLIQSILKSEIVNSILDWIQKKKDAETSKMERSLKKVKVDKLIDCNTSNRETAEIFIMEGLSALGDFRQYRNPKTQAAFTLRGKFINTNTITNKKILENEEASGLLTSLGLSLFDKSIKNLRFGSIIINSDMDFDGDSITGLLLNFFSRWPELFQRKIVKRSITPLLVIKIGKEKKYFYNHNEYEEWLVKNKNKKFELDYKKGLGSLETEEFKEMIQNTKLITFKPDDISDIDAWFGNNPVLRKNKLI